MRDNGRPVPGLQEKDFRVFEDGKLVPPKKGKRALLEAESVTANFTLVQVDLSGPIADSEYLSDLAETVTKFAQDLNERQEVAVNAFDGNDEVAPFIGFGSGKEQFSNLAEGLRKFRPRSRNSNLYGAVYQGISALEEKLATSPFTEKQATLIVFTDRTDLSHTVGIDQLKEKLRGTSVQIYVIGAGEQINKQDLTMLGKTGVILSNDPRGFKKAFDEVNQKLVSVADGRYVLSYCSTKRKGSHKLEIEMDTPAGEAKVKHKFNAAGFSNGCSPKIKPRVRRDRGVEGGRGGQAEGDRGEGEREGGRGGGGRRGRDQDAGAEQGREERHRQGADEDRQQGLSQGHGESCRQGAVQGRPRRTGQGSASASGGPAARGERGPEGGLRPRQAGRRHRVTARPGWHLPRRSARRVAAGGIAGPLGGVRGTYWLGLVTNSCDAGRSAR